MSASLQFSNVIDEQDFAARLAAPFADERRQLVFFQPRTWEQEKFVVTYREEDRHRVEQVLREALESVSGRHVIFAGELRGEAS